MKRRKFIEKVALTAAVAGVFSVNEVTGLGLKSNRSTSVNDEFAALIEWMKVSGWAAYLQSITGVDFNLTGNALKDALNKTLPDVSGTLGFDDFGGISMIEGGRPSMSLLYHALASPRVKSSTVTQYPSLLQIDQLENYIYSLQKLNIPDAERKDYVFAVFSYEYRPAFRTPTTCPHAEFVYSRIGIARIGNRERNYDAENRCFINKPTNSADVKQIAVTPAKYALFLARKVTTSEVFLMSEESYDIVGSGQSKKERHFLMPVRKVFDGDPFLKCGNIRFSESHRNEKLYRLTTVSPDKIYPPSDTYDVNTPPFKRVSFTYSDDRPGIRDKRHTDDLVNLTKTGSCTWLGSIPKPLINVATQNNKIICFHVPPKEKIKLETTRRYTTLKTQIKLGDEADYFLTEGVFRSKKPTRFSMARNAPLFVNIRNPVQLTDLTKHTHLDGGNEDFLTIINNGEYYTAMFSDNCCDGCVSAEVESTEQMSLILGRPFNHCLPAFSVVTAPDFFPQADSFDLDGYDDNGTSSFLEGGTENLSTCRLGANSYITNPVTDSTAFKYARAGKDMQYQQPEFVEVIKSPDQQLDFDVSDTLIALISTQEKILNENYHDNNRYSEPQKRDYENTSYLSDTASFFFAPGWDVSYSSDSKNYFLATFGLGSPFPEDIKLCAAGNGMWPLASPDAARTFQGSLEPIRQLKGGKKVPPTAIPLMDIEIGIHPNHPGLLDPTNNLKTGFGWDGEHGPFLEKKDHEKDHEFCVNATDIGRADYVYNALNPDIGFDMSQLRQLTCGELISRIESLRNCKSSIDPDSGVFTNLWLVSAEAVSDWSSGARAIGIPTDLVGNTVEWARVGQPLMEGPGYLFVFTRFKKKYQKAPKEWYPDKFGKRRRTECLKIYVCQVCKKGMTWCEIPSEGMTDTSGLIWL